MDATTPFALSPRSYPALNAMTRHFTVGEPRTFTITPDGGRVYFLRAAGPTTAVLGLWCLTLGGEESGERFVVDPLTLLADVEDVPDAERQRRERLRETSAGITSYSVDDAVSRATFALSGRLFVVDLAEGAVHQVGDDEGVIDPRLDPTGRRVAYVVGSTLRVLDLETEAVTAVAEAAGDQTVGLADFVAAEEFDRSRGHWWSPDGEWLCYETVDQSPVELVWIFDPIDPRIDPQSRRYPRAGSANPVVGLVLVGPNGSTEVSWDRERYPYLVTVSWPYRATDSGPLLTIMSRDHRDQRVVVVDPATGVTSTLHEAHDDAFLEWIGGLPSFTPDGRLVVAMVDHETDTYRVALVDDGVAEPFSPPGLQIGAVVDVGEHALLVTAKPTAVSQIVAEIAYDATVRERGDGSAMTRALAGRARGTVVVATSDFEREGVVHLVEGEARHVVSSVALTPRAATPPVVAAPHRLEVSSRGLEVVVLLPSTPFEGRLPIILSPYGGPHHQRVVAHGAGFAAEQYLADQGFCVVVADGRGTGGRGPAWDRSIVAHLDDAPVEDQVAALEGVVEQYGDLVDPGRVGVHGWSFGGYLAARCVMARPDVFHAAVAGAPVTDWRWYDTGYTERYLGHPDESPDVYDRHSLIPLAPRLERPLLLIHGYHDDNVLFCHTQRLSAALTAAGRGHRVVGLSGTTHMAADPEIAESLLAMQVAFFHETLAPVAGIA